MTQIAKSDQMRHILTDKMEAYQMASNGGGVAQSSGASQQNKRSGQFESGTELTPKQQAFVRAYLSNGCQQGKAAETAGYANPAVSGSKIMHLPAVKHAIGMKMIDRTLKGAIKGVKWMVDALDSKTVPPAVQFQCAKWLAEGSGYGLAAKKAKELADDGSFAKSPRDMTVTELEALVRMAQARYDQVKAEHEAIDGEAHNEAHNGIGFDDESEQ